MVKASPPPRRKSCVACIKAKRRCDLGTPACQRCVQRAVDCVYLHGPMARLRRDAAVASASSRTRGPEPSVPPATEITSTSSITSAPGPDLGLDLGLELAQPILTWTDGLQQPSEPTLLQPEHTVPETINDLPVVPGPDSSVSTNEQSNDSSSLEELGGAISSPATLAVSSYLERSIPQQLLEFSLRTRLRYAIDTIFATPKKMLHEGHMPWSHPQLYQDWVPRSMQDTISSIALQEAKGLNNSLVIATCVGSRIHDLLSDHSAAPFPLESLARTQSLLTYLILRITDTSLHNNWVSAEEIRSSLESSAFELLPHITFDDPDERGNVKTPETLPIYPVGVARDFWNDWVFQESARRTLFITFFFIQAHRYMTGDKVPQRCDTNMLYCLSWSMSAHLWGAKDPVDFAAAWQNKRHMVCKPEMMNNVLETFKDAEADDIDDFAKIILSSVMGIDETKAWLYIRGATL